ncbi:MAG: hypothetical protein FJX35_08745 [Alphaproteobacteria bacterium]|nr:hypothetical protein [Alphaproteobacteria bacterium]
MKRSVEAGQRFQVVDKTAYVWEVERVSDKHGIPHASLTRVGEATERRLVSVTILLDRGRYRPVAHQPPAPAAPGSSGSGSS